MKEERYFKIYCFLIFIIFILTYKNSVYYVLLIPLDAIILFLNRKSHVKSNTAISSLILFLVLIVFGYSFFYEVDSKGRCVLFLFEIVFLHLYLKSTRVSRTSLLKAVNVTFLLYVGLSIINFRYMSKNGITIFGVNTLNIFDVSVMNRNVKTFCGLAGSTSDIDSYSGLVFILNYVFKGYINENVRKTMMGIALFVSLATFRFTPIVSLVAVIILFSIKNNNVCSIMKNMIFLVSYNSFLIIYYVEGLVRSDKLVSILYSITHGRANIWVKFLEVLRDGEMEKIIFGFKENVPMIRIDGSILVHNNPHSSYLRIFLVYGLIIFILIGLYFFINIKSIKTRECMIIVSYTLICSITNEGILYLRNPIWLITMYFCFFQKVQENIKEIKQ